MQERGFGSFFALGSTDIMEEDKEEETEIILSQIKSGNYLNWVRHEIFRELLLVESLPRKEH